jgi:hypothetical protein
MPALVAAALLAAAAPARAEPPVPTIAQPGDGARVRNVVLSGTVADPLVQVVVTEDGVERGRTGPGLTGDWSLPIPGVPDGPHSYVAHSEDLLGGVSPDSSPKPLFVDTAPPSVSVAGPAATNDTTPEFTFSSDDPQATFRCRLDGPYAPCASPYTLPELADGAYELFVQATDEAGNPAETSRRFAVDTLAPDTAIASGPDGPTNSFTLAASEDGTFTCGLTGREAFPCGSAVSLGELPDGAYTFTAFATDTAGNADRTPATRTFTIARPAAAPSPTPRPVSAAFHRTVVVRRFGGTVRVRRAGSRTYTELTAAQALPLGSSVDAKRGSVVLTSVPKPGGTPQRTTLDGGVFRVTQSGGVTVLTLTERLAPCRGKGRHSRRLTGNGSGAFRTRGAYSSASGGQRWVVRDSCAGTLTRVIQGVVRVRDDVRRRTVLVRAGKRYLARPRH